MSAPNLNIRAQVMDEIMTTIRTAEDAGQDGYAEARRVYPAVPTSVIAEAWARVGHDRDEAWWASVERTIEGEIIQRAISAPSKGGEA
ncbi:hypothetical protein [Kaistia adipata]|uniref:hypothetical protein n=1 Tax=Kaistia adipata TaxID=166954 RepID=UPI0004269E6C|nr:hypothetical protein [Kaistia adipata]